MEIDTVRRDNVFNYLTTNWAGLEARQLSVVNAFWRYYCVAGCVSNKVRSDRMPRLEKSLFWSSPC